MMTAFLSRTDVSRHLQALHLLQALREALSTPSTSSHSQTFALEPTAVIRQAALDTIPAWMVSVRVKTPKGPRAVLQLHDKASGQLLAVMDAGHLTQLRSSLLSALAVDILARPDAKNVAVLGSGAAASSALKALRLVRSIEHVWLYEPQLADNFELAHRLGTTLSMAIHSAQTAQEAVAAADIVVLTGAVSLDESVLRAGTHVTVLSAETFERPPLSAQVLSEALRVCDANEPALWGLPFHAPLGEILAQRAPGRSSAEQLTVFSSVGPATLDLLAAWHVYEGARNDEALTRINMDA